MKIVEISKTNVCSPFEFNGPCVDITREQTVSVQSIFLELDKSIRVCLVDLATTLVDKSVANPSQIISSFFKGVPDEIFWSWISLKLYPTTKSRSLISFLTTKTMSDHKIGNF